MIGGIILGYTSIEREISVVEGLYYIWISISLIGLGDIALHKYYGNMDDAFIFFMIGIGIIFFVIFIGTLQAYLVKKCRIWTSEDLKMFLIENPSLALQYYKTKRENARARNSVLLSKERL